MNPSTESGSCIGQPGARDGLRLGEAVRLYFRENGFDADGGYGAAWVDFELGPIPFPFPNSRARKRAVPFHDLHHLVTGYATNTVGEFEISAWEIASGCRDFFAAWQLNLAGLFGGAVLAPRRTWRAFLRGRHSDNFYGRSYDGALLSTTVGDARRALGLDAPEPRLCAIDVALYCAAVAAGGIAGAAFIVLFAPLAVVAWPVLRFLRRADGEASAATTQLPPSPGVHDADAGT